MWVGVGSSATWFNSVSGFRDSVMTLPISSQALNAGEVVSSIWAGASG